MKFWIFLCMIPAAYSHCLDIGGVCSASCSGEAVEGLPDCAGKSCCVDNIAARCLFCIRPTGKGGKPSALPLCEQDGACVSAGGVCQSVSYDCTGGRTTNLSYTCAQPNKRRCCKGSCPAIIEREIWNADPPTQSSTHTTLLPIVVVHQTAGCNQDYNSRACVTDTLRGIQKEHMETLIDMGYDYLIDAAGRVFKGSKMVINPGITHDYPGETLNIAMIGQFNDKSASAAALDSLSLTLGCLVDEQVLDADYVIHAAWQTPICGEELYKVLTTTSNYQSVLTEDEKAAYIYTLGNKEWALFMEDTTEIFCDLHKDDPSIAGKEPCTPNCDCLNIKEVTYILDFLDDPTGAKDYYIKVGEHYKAENYTVANLKKYIQFHMNRAIEFWDGGIADLYLTAYSKMYEYKYGVMLSVFEE